MSYLALTNSVNTASLCADLRSRSQMEAQTEKQTYRFVQAEQCRASHVRTVSILPLSVRVDDKGSKGEAEAA